MPILESFIVGASIVGGIFLLNKLIPIASSKIENSWKENNYKIIDITFSQNKAKAIQLLRYIADYQFFSNNGKYVNVNIDGNNYTVPLNKLCIEHDKNQHRIYFKVITDSSNHIMGISVFTFIKKNRFQIDTGRIQAFDNFIASFNPKSAN